MIICENVHTLGYSSRGFPLQPKAWDSEEIRFTAPPFAVYQVLAFLVNQERGRSFQEKVFQFLSFGILMMNPVESPEFFRFMRQLLKLSSKCEDHIFT